MPVLMLRLFSFVLAGALLLAACAKIFSAHDPTALLSREMSILVALVELAAALLLCCGYRALGALLTVGIMTGGVILAWSRESPCGCLGTLWELSRTSELLIAGTLGALASLVLCVTLDTDRSELSRRPA